MRTLGCVLVISLGATGLASAAPAELAATAEPAAPEEKHIPPEATALA